MNYFRLYSIKISLIPRKRCTKLVHSWTACGYLKQCTECSNKLKLLGIYKTMATVQRFPEKFVSVDVECVATGRRHDAKAVASVAVVDQHERVLLKRIVKPDKPVVSYLTPVTGLRHGDLDRGVPLERAVREVKALLGPDVVLVGQGVKGDILWMHLEEGVDFASAVDLGTMFRVFNTRHQKYFYYTLQHEADTLLEKG